MPPPIVPGADHPDAPDRPRLGVLGQALDLVGLALGEEEILLRLGLRAAHQLHEQLALFDDAFGIRHLARDADRFDVLERRLEAAELARILLAELLEHRGVALVDLVLPLGAFRQRPDVAHLLGIADRVRDQLVLDQPIDEPAFETFASADRIAGGAHLERLAHTRDARQPLRPAGTGEQPQLHLGRAELRRRHRHAIMAAERDFEPAAERRTVDRRDHRLGAILDPVDHLRQPRHHRRLAELGDVRAGEESLPFAGDHHRVDARRRPPPARSPRPAPAAPPLRARSPAGCWRGRSARRRACGSKSG